MNFLLADSSCGRTNPAPNVSLIILEAVALFFSSIPNRTLADLLRVVVVVLELQPLGLDGEFAKYLEQAQKIFVRTIDSHRISSFTPPWPGRSSAWEGASRGVR